MVRPVLSCGGQSSFVGGCGEHVLSLVGFHGLWVTICGWCIWLLMVVVIACVCSWPVAVVVLLLLDSWGCLPWYGDGFVVGQHVVVAVSSVVGVVVMG